MRKNEQGKDEPRAASLLPRPDDAEWLLVASLFDEDLASRFHGLGPEHFQNEHAREVWRSASHVASRQQYATPDATSIVLRGTTSAQDLESIVKRYRSDAVTVGDAAKVLRDRRRIDTLIDVHKAAVSELTQGKSVSMRSVVSQLIDIESASVIGIEDETRIADQLRQSFTTPSTHIPTGIRALDQVLDGGLSRKRLTSFIAKYKIGKTTLLATVGYNAQEQGHNVLNITLERSSGDIQALNVARGLGINVRKLSQNYAQYEQDHRNFIARKDRGRAYYYHKPGATLEDIVWQIHAARRQYGVSLVLIDYYQLVAKPPKLGTVDHLREVDQTLANLFADSDMAGVIAAQADDEGRPRDCKTLLHSAAANFTIRRVPDGVETWLENMASNYIDMIDAGSPSNPAMMFDKEIGPHFRSV